MTEKYVKNKQNSRVAAYPVERVDKIRKTRAAHKKAHGCNKHRGGGAAARFLGYYVNRPYTVRRGGGENGEQHQRGVKSREKAAFAQRHSDHGHFAEIYLIIVYRKQPPHQEQHYEHREARSEAGQVCVGARFELRAHGDEDRSGGEQVVARIARSGDYHFRGVQKRLMLPVAQQVQRADYTAENDDPAENGV